MTRSLLTAITLLPLASACTITVDDSPPRNNNTSSYVDYEDPPLIEWADSGCYWDSYYGDYIWWFEADVTDPDGAFDVAEVFADVYDDYLGQWVDTFELLQESPNPANWFSDWMEFSTWLDCSYGGYTVEFVAYDFDDNMDVLDVVPYTEY